MDILASHKINQNEGPFDKALLKCPALDQRDK